MSPTQRSLRMMRDAGYFAAVVEKWNPHMRIRQDLFGFCDVVCVDKITGRVEFIQVTSGSNVSARIKKILVSQEAKAISNNAYSVVVIHGWRKAGPRGKRKKWECRFVYPFSIKE